VGDHRLSAAGGGYSRCLFDNFSWLPVVNAEVLGL
jgi:hypothetical protein